LLSLSLSKRAKPDLRGTWSPTIEASHYLRPTQFLNIPQSEKKCVLCGCPRLSIHIRSSRQVIFHMLRVRTDRMSALRGWDVRLFTETDSLFSLAKVCDIVKTDSSWLPYDAESGPLCNVVNFDRVCK
jgi:hypothetical protein